MNEDVFPIQDRDFPLLCLFTGGYNLGNMWQNWMFKWFARNSSSDFIWGFLEHSHWDRKGGNVFFSCQVFGIESLKLKVPETSSSHLKPQTKENKWTSGISIKKHWVKFFILRLSNSLKGLTNILLGKSFWSSSPAYCFISHLLNYRACEKTCFHRHGPS